MLNKAKRVNDSLTYLKNFLLDLWLCIEVYKKYYFLLGYINNYSFLHVFTGKIALASIK